MVKQYNYKKKADGKTNATGAPPMYNTPEEMQDIIDQYFIDCEGKPYIDDSGTAVLDKHGNPIIVGAKPPTITGLALALGFNSRQALLNYQGKKDFNDAITRAKARSEAYAEARLYDKDGANGAKFSLANNFKGWAEKQEVTVDQDKPFEVNIKIV